MRLVTKLNIKITFLNGFTKDITDVLWCLNFVSWCYKIVKLFRYLSFFLKIFIELLKLQTF